MMLQRWWWWAANLLQSRAPIILEEGVLRGFFREGERINPEDANRGIKEDPQRWEGNRERVGSWDLREELLGEESLAVLMLPRECARQGSSSHRKE